MQTWQLQHAKAKFSEVVDTAEKKGPQMITRRGIETVVVVPVAEWKRLHSEQPHKAKRTLLEVLQSGPRFDIPLPPRHRRMTRKSVAF